LKVTLVWAGGRSSSTQSHRAGNRSTARRSRTASRHRPGRATRFPATTARARRAPSTPRERPYR
jgi:hypothetical protein